MLTANIFKIDSRAIGWSLAVIFSLAALSGNALAASVDAATLSYYEKLLSPSAARGDGQSSGFEGFVKKTKRTLSSHVLERQQILEDLNIWIDLNPHDDLTPRALMLRAEMNRGGIDNHLALLDWLRVAVLFSASTYASKAKSLAYDSIGDSKYKRDKETLESILKSRPKGKISYRHAALLASMSALSGSHFRDPLARACRVFLANFRSHEMAPMIQMALADNRATVDVKEALFHYKTLIAVYPRSSYVGEAMVKVADINQERLSNPEEAIALYNDVIKRYPGSTAARKSYLNLATTYEHQYKKEEMAIQALNKLVSKYPRTAEASEGGETLGRLYERTKQYDAAVTAYRNMANISRDRDAIRNSLEKASLLAVSKLKNYKLTIDIDNQICRSYPKDDACAEARYKSGELYEKKLSDSKQAIEEYQAVVKSFPEHRLAKRSASRIKALKGGGMNLNLDLF